MKTFSFKLDPLTGEEYLEVYLRGRQLITDPLLNKTSGFSQEERLTLGLEGYLRAQVSTIEEQLARSLEMYRRKQDDLERYIFLMSLLDRSEVLFYRLLTEHLEEMVPIVYTPVVGQACLQMSHIMRRFRGIYVTPETIANIDSIFQNISRPQIHLIVVTDGERILGLGDLGSDGMGIPVGKVNLYVAAGGLHPAVCLPVCLDVGTNNARLREDPLYLGRRAPRLDGRDYEVFVEKFVQAVKRNFPEALLQWEDFAKNKAFVLLERYRERILSFNDDIQGTGATALAALYTAMRIQSSRFQDQRFVIVGMGQAGVGIASNIRTALCEEGLDAEAVRARIFALDQPGLLFEDTPGLEAPQRAFAQPRAAVAGWRLARPGEVSLADVVTNAEATVLVGVTARPGLFDASILGALARNTARPVVMALSNPTAKCECTLEDVVRATDGRGLAAFGSPFAPVDAFGRRHVGAQCNNLYMFPGVGLGALIARAPKVTDAMFLAASKTLSGLVSEAERAEGRLLPDMRQIREVSCRVALAVATEARDSRLGRLIDDAKLESLIRKAQWEPHYAPYRPGAPR
ncbi:MAG: NAD-dependent malic enzyme [Myxococcales bacterium]|nr:NAD-dependent malic enzyme [Myxococcales bacterium]